MIMLLVMSASILSAQTSVGVLKLSLAEAQKYALDNNLSVSLAKQDIEIARRKTWEAISQMLPQISGSASLNDNLKLMTTLLPGEIVGQPGELIPVQFGSQFNSSFGADASMVLFNGQAIVGFQMAKLAQKLATVGVEQSEQDVKESVINTYYLILISEESMRIIDGNIEALNETLRSTRAMLSVGMAEATDVDQMVSNVSMMQNTRSSMERTIELSHNMLRFQLGLSPETKIELTETLDNIIASTDVAQLVNTEFNLNNNISYKLIEGHEEMSQLSLKLAKSSILPSVATFYAYNKNGQGDKLGDLRWFPNSMLGFQLSVPIFSSGMRYSKIKAAEATYVKASIEKEIVKDGLLLQERQLRYNVVNAHNQYLLQKENIEVSKRIYKSIENKFGQGMASSLEVTQANTNYLQAENNYITALMTLLQSKASLDKLIGNF